MIKRVVSLILAVAMICSVMPVYATESAEVPAKASGTASGYDGSYGGAASGVTGGVAGGTVVAPGGAGPYLTGKINVPAGYVFSGEERLEIYICESYESAGYEHYARATINSDGTYEAYIPSDLTGVFAVSVYARGFSAPAVDGSYNCHNDAMITFTGSNVSGVDFTIEKGKTVSGIISLGADAVLENSMLYGLICAYEYDGEFIDMKEMDEGQFSTFFKGETGSFEYELTIPESAKNIVLSVRARSEQMSDGSFKSNILDDYVYYAGDNSSLDYTQAQVIAVDGDTSDIDIQLHTGVGFAYYGKLPVDIYKQYADFYIADKTDNSVIYNGSMYLDVNGTNGSTVFPKEYLNKEVYVYYDFKYNNDTLYTEPLYINPDGSLVKTKEEATPHILTGANYVSFTAGLKSEFTTGIKGKITFEQGCDIGNGGGYYEVTAYNTDTDMYYYSGYKNITEIGEYEYVIPVTEQGNYKLWVSVNFYSSTSNVSECDYYYTSDGMVYNLNNAEVVDTTVKNTGIDFEFKKKKQFKGKVVADEEIVYTENFKPQFTIQSDNGNYWENITLNEDLTFDINIPAKITGDCTAYLDIGTGSNIIPDCYFYLNDETNGRFDADAGEIIEFKLETGNLIKGKIKLPENISTMYSRSFEVCLATVNSNGYVNINQRYYTSNEEGTAEAEFMFAVPKTQQTEYIIYGQLQGTVTNIYNGIFYYTGQVISSINHENAVKVTGGTENIIFNAIAGTTVPVTVTNPADGEYHNGNYTIDFGDFEESRYFYLSAGQMQEDSIVLTDEHIGLEAYVYYTVNSHNNTYIYVNPDGSLTNNRNEAKPHKITESTSFNINLSSDEELYAIPSIKGTLSLSESAYVTYKSGENATLYGTMYLIKDGWQEGYQSVELSEGEVQNFNFELDEIGDYTITLYLDNRSYDTNVVCNKTMYYTGDGWTDNREDAKLINNATEQNLMLFAPELDVISGNVEFADGTFLDEEMSYQVTYTAVDGSGSFSKSGYIKNAEDFEYKITASSEDKEYYVSVNFGSYYSDYDTNIPYGKTYYLTENGLTTDESAVRKAVKGTDKIILNIPVNPTIRGTVKFPEGAELSGNGSVYIYLTDENGRQITYKGCEIDKAEDFLFAIAGNEETEKYSVSVSFNSYGNETEVEESNLYYTKEGMTSNVNGRKFYTIEELTDIELNLRNKRYVTGKIITENFVNYEETLTARVEFQTERMRTYQEVVFDEDLNYKIQIPSDVDGNFCMGFEFSTEHKNNIIKDTFFYYADAEGEKKKISYPSCENINITAETGYIFSGVVKLPENAVVYENCDITGGIGYGSYDGDFRIPYGEREGEFFITLPKAKYREYLTAEVYVSSQERCENLYGDCYYKNDNTSVVKKEDATRYVVESDITDAQIMLITGAVYKINVKKPASVTGSETVKVYGKIGEDTMYSGITMYSDETEKEVSLIIPEYYYGKEMYLYYLLTDSRSNSLYREEVYISPDGSLKGAERIADTFTVSADGCQVEIELAEYTADDIEFPEYVYKSPYPYKNYEDNSYSYEYTESDCDYLKVTFAPETYLGYYDYADIYDKDGQQVGRYSSGSLAGKSVNIPGNGFTVSIKGDYCYTAFGIAIERIEPKKYTLETDHPYISSEKKSYPYTHKTEADGLRLYFSEDTDFYGYMTITYTHNGEIKEKGGEDYNIAGNYVDIRGNSFTITMPADNSGDYYGFTIVEIEEIEYFDVTFKNYDGTVLDETEVEKGESVYYNKNTPVRERDEDYIYTFEGWDKSLDNIKEDTVITAQFKENPYATVTFKNSTDDENILYTDYVILGENAYYDGDVMPSKASTEAKAYVFAGWSRSLINIKEDVEIYAKFEECDILVQSSHPYTAKEEIKTYTYEGSADSIVLIFSSDSVIDENGELIIYDENDTPIYYLSGNITEEPITVTGKTAKFEIVGEGNGKFGYALAKVEPMWHDFSDWYQYDDPDCTNEGEENRRCYNCHTEEERKVPALGHSFGAWEEDTDGNIFRECIRCPEREMAENASDMGTVNITVVDAVTMKPLENVTLTAYDEEGNETVWYTNEEGIAPQILKKGVNNIVVYAKDYIMRNVSIEVNAGITNVPVIGLTEKPAVECKINATPMTKDEMIEAGIDINAYENQHIYKYEINIGFGEPKSVYFTEGGKHVDTGGNLYVHNDETGDGATIHPINDKYYLVIYGNSKWLKEMFDVELVAFNTSNTDTVENLTAEIKIPDGMSLAAMNTLPQSDVQRMGSLASGKSKSVHWYLRGDDAGEYNISAKLTGTLMPFDEQFGYEYTTDEPVKVYAGNALQMNIVVPAIASYGEDYTVKIEIENVSDKSVYNLSNTIDKTLQSKFLSVGTDGYEKYFEENAIGYIAVEELKPGEKIVAEIKANILFRSDIIKDKIATLANRLENETDVLAVFNSFKSTLDLLNDNYDIIYNALGNVERTEGFEELETLLNDCAELVKWGSSSRAMYFINRLKQENTLEELTNLSKDSNFYMVWSEERLNKLYDEMRYLYSEALKPENCSNYDIYEDVKKTLRAVPVNFWFKDLFVAKLGGSTTEIPYTVKVIPSDGSHTQITNISNYYYNILTGAIEMLSQPWYTEIIGEIRDREGVAGAKEIIKTDTEKSLTFAVTDVSGDTRFNAWVEGEDGKHFTISSTAEETQVTESGITFIGSAYLTVGAETTGKGTLYIEKVSEIATFGARTGAEAFEIEVVDAHNCASEKWVEMVTAYDDNDGYDAKYCDVCNTLIDIRCVKATNRCDGNYQVTEEKVTEEGYSCILTFDEETPARSAVAVVVMKDEKGETVKTGTDAIKIKPSSTVEVKVPFENAEGLQPKLMLWDSLTRLRPIGK